MIFVFKKWAVGRQQSIKGGPIFDLFDAHFFGPILILEEANLKITVFVGGFNWGFPLQVYLLFNQ